MTNGYWQFLTLEDFFSLVAAHQLESGGGGSVGGTSSAGFRARWKEISEEIEAGMKAGLARVDEGYPFRFGVGVPRGLQRVRVEAGEQMEYAEQLAALEAMGRPRMLEARSGRFGLGREGGEERRGEWACGMVDVDCGELEWLSLGLCPSTSGLSQGKVEDANIEPRLLS